MMSVHRPGELQKASVMSVMLDLWGDTPDEGTPTVDAASSAAAVGRGRRAFPDGDNADARNQQLFPEAVTTRVLAPETRTSPGRISDMVTGLSPDPTGGICRARGQSAAWPDDQAIEDIGSALGQDEMASYRAGQ